MIIVRRYGYEWENFGSVSEQINDVYYIFAPSRISRSEMRYIDKTSSIMIGPYPYYQTALVEIRTMTEDTKDCLNIISKLTDKSFKI